MRGEELPESGVPEPDGTSPGAKALVVAFGREPVRELALDDERKLDAERCAQAGEPGTRRHDDPIDVVVVAARLNGESITVRAPLRDVFI
jgi:hypothetical protein